MAGLAALRPSGFVRHGDEGCMHRMYRFGERRTLHGLVPRRAGPRRLKVARYVIAVAVGAVHRTDAAETVVRCGRVIFFQEGGAVAFVMDLEYVDGRLRLPRRELRSVGVVVFPVCILL